MNRNQNESRNLTASQDLVKAIDCWEESITWIEKGWDCLEEYTHDVSYRHDLDDRLEQVGGLASLPEDLRLRIARLDERFILATEDSDLCIFETGPPFTYANGCLCWFQGYEYEKDTHWYYFRWQTDCPVDFRGYDALSYWAEAYGMDFMTMNKEQLKAVAMGMVEECFRDIQADSESANEIMGSE